VEIVLKDENGKMKPHPFEQADEGENG
jgi:hypothetical protein